MVIDRLVRRLRRTLGRSGPDQQQLAQEHAAGRAARAGLPDRADLRRVGLGGQTTGSGAS